MPFEVVKVDNVYRIKNTETGEITKPKFNTKKTAESQIKKWHIEINNKKKKEKRKQKK